MSARWGRATRRIRPDESPEARQRAEAQAKRLAERRARVVAQLSGPPVPDDGVSPRDPGEVRERADRLARRQRETEERAAAHDHGDDGIEGEQ